MATQSTSTTRRLSRPARLALWGLGLPILLVLVVVAAAVISLGSQAGSAWLLARVPGLQVQGLQGALLSGDLRADQLRWEGAAGRLQIDGLQLSGRTWHWRPTPRAWIGIDAGEWRANRVQWSSAESNEKTPPAPLSPPSDLQLPLQAQLRLVAQSVQIDSLAPLQDLALVLQIGADDGQRHLLELQSLQWDKLRAAGRMQVASAAPFALDSALKLQSTDGAPMPWQADVSARGELARIDLQAALRTGAEARGGKSVPALALEAAVTPFEAWPLAGLSATTDKLDLSALASSLPQTALTARAVLHSRALDQPVQAELDASNALPGRWNEARLPVRELQLALEATPAQLDRVDISRFDVRFGDGAGATGRWSGQGQWAGQRLTLDTELKDLAPHRLDGRAAPMSIQGPIKLILDGLPSPDPASTAQAKPIVASIDARLEGQIDGAPERVELDFKGRAGDGMLKVEQLKARAGQARADVQADARRTKAGWSLDSHGTLVDFDPQPWWQGPAGSSWQRGSHRLNGDWALALTLPAKAVDLPPPEMLQHLGGQGRITIDRSRLAGVPLEASLDLARSEGINLRARLVAGTNMVAVEGRARPLGPGADDRWKIEIDAPNLANLAPLAGLHPALVAWAPRKGWVQAKVAIDGRWPALRSEGEAQIDALQAGPLAVQKAQLTWRAATEADAPLSADIDAREISWAAQRIPELRATLSGTGRAHRIEAQASLPLQPPPAVAKSFGLRPGKGTRLSLKANGNWAPGPDGSNWAARIEQLAAGLWDGRAMAADMPVATDWLDARDLRAQFELDAQGSLKRLHADAGVVKLAGDLHLRWDDIVYAPRAGRPLLQIQAQIETFAVAPLLTRWQPALGWAGDLRIGARVDVRAGDQFDADIVIERESGDLTVSEGTDTPLALGLTDLRLALNAHDGTWLFTQGLAGRTLGELGGLLRVRATPQDLWPAASAPIDGSLLMRVGNLSIWGAWVPPGWRLTGSLQTSGVFAGTFGAPQVKGELKGENIGVRNPLEGVHVRDGMIRATLDGERATIEQFTLHAGDGVLKLSGGAELGAEPSARLSLDADRFQVLGRVDRRLIASGRAELAMDAKLFDLSGGFKVDEGLFDISRANAPSLDSDVVVRRPIAEADEEEEETATNIARPGRKIQVALGLDLGDKLVVRGRGLRTELTGKLRISAPGGKLAVNGTVNTIGGYYAAYGQEMTIRRGEVAFSGPVEAPRLDVLALRPKLDIEVGVAITGTPLTPRVRLYSNPEMSDTDKLSWLVLGRAPDGLGRTDTALLQRAAIALLSGEEAGPTDALLRNLGIDEFSVRQSEDGDVTDTVITIGKQISDRWYVGYERGMNATTGTWQLIYRVAQRFTLRAQSGDDNALDAIWIWRVK